MNPFDDVQIVLAIPPTHYVIEHVKPRIRLDLLPGTKDNPLWMEAGFLSFVESSNEKKEAEATEIIDARAQAKKAAAFMTGCSIVGWSIESPDGSWVPYPYTPEKGCTFLSRIIDMQGGLGVYRQIEAAIVDLSSKKTKAVDAEEAAGNSSGG